MYKIIPLSPGEKTIRTVVQEISSKVQSIANCESPPMADWKAKHRASLKELLDFLPSGSGFDSGTELYPTSTPERLVFEVDFHHMNQDGFYTNWTKHRVIVTPCFAGFNVKVMGPDQNGIKDHIAECFHHALSERIAE